MINNLYDARVKRIKKTLAFEKADRVPIVPLVQEWAMSYAEIKTLDCMRDAEKEKAVYKKFYTDFDFDATMYMSMTPVDIFNDLGNTAYFISDDDYSVQCKHSFEGMETDEYDPLTQNPFSFLANVILPRKFPELKADTVYDILKDAMIHLSHYFEHCAEMTRYAKEDLNIPIFRNGLIIAPIDLMLSSLRGFAPLLRDMRKNKEALKEALNVLLPFCSCVYGMDENQIETFPPYGTNGITGSFLSPKQFKEFLLPTYEPEVLKVHRGGGQVSIHTQGKWAQHYDWFNSMPKGLFIIFTEEDDVFAAKKKLGHNCIVCGGLNTNLLRHGTKEQCLDFTKRVIDECAGDGGFMFSNDIVWSSPDDVKPENLESVIDCIHTYGKY